MDISISKLVSRIHLTNKSWKIAVERFGVESPISKALRNRKSGLQVRLLREYPEKSWLQIDNETISDEPLFSVRLLIDEPKAFMGRVDADHIPVRIANEVFTEHEIKGLEKDER